MATTFNAVFYLQSNPDVAAVVATGTVTALQHFQLFGSKEGRNPNAFFNDAYYLAQNPDVSAAVKAGTIDALTHFAAFGFKELRDANQNFNTKLYLLNNPDVSAAVRAGLIDALTHWNLFGRNENRVAYDNSSPPKLIPAGTVISTTVGTAQAGSTFNLTTATDNLTGTSGADTFNAIYDANSGPTGSQTTFNPLDSVKGGGSGVGTNTLALTVIDDSAAATTVTLANVLGPTVSNVQNINIKTTYSSGAIQAGTFVYNATNTTGATQWIVGGTSQAAVSIFSIGNVASSSNGATTSNIALLGNSGGVTIQFNSALLTGTADTLNLNVGGTNSGLVSLGGSAAGSTFETVNITASANGALNVPQFGDSVGGAQTINLTGSGNLVLGNNSGIPGATNGSAAASNELKFGLTQSNSSGTLNASTFTGNLNVAFFDNNSFVGINGGAAGTIRDAVTVTGGSGTNRFNFGAGLNTSDSVNGGTSGKNTLAISTPSSLVSGLAISNIQVLEADALTGTYTVSNLNGGNVGVLLAGPGPLTAASGNNVTVTGLFSTGPNNVTVSGAGWGANAANALTATLAVSGATTAGQFDIVNTTLVATGATGITINSLSMAGVETLNLTSNLNGSTTLGTGQANAITALTDSNLTSVNVAGAGALNLNLSGNSALLLVNAATATGNMTIVGATAGTTAERITAGSGATSIAGTAASGDIVVGGSGNNTLQGGQGADTITGGSGKTIFRYTNVIDSETSGGTGVDLITDFATGRDKFAFAPGNTLGNGFSAGAGGLGTSTAGSFAAGTAVYVALVSGTTTASGLDTVGSAGEALLAATTSTSTGTFAVAVVTVTSGSLLGTYLFIQDSGSGGGSYNSTSDMIINITGATAAPVASDFTFF